MFLSIETNVWPSFRWILSRIIFGTAYPCSAPLSILILLPLFLRLPLTALLFFSELASSLKASSCLVIDLVLYLCFLMGLLLRNSFLLYKASLLPVLIYALFEWFSYFSVTKLERLHQTASRPITGSLSFSHIPPL